jgi:YfiR/HmsC-like
MTVPVNLQARLLTRLLANERGFARRVTGDVVIHLVEAPGDDASEHGVQQMRATLTDIGEVNGHRLRIEIVKFSNPAALVASCQAKNVHALYVSPGLGSNVAAIAKALVGNAILTFAAVESYVQAGIVVGVALVSGRPKMSIHLGQARAQGLDIPSAILALAKVYS